MNYHVDEKCIFLGSGNLKTQIVSDARHIGVSTTAVSKMLSS